jgi:hypothetical protein
MTHEKVFAWKKRMDLVDKSALKELIFYPDADVKLKGFVRKNMKTAGRAEAISLDVGERLDGRHAVIELISK